MNTGRIEILAGCIAVRHPGPDQSDDGQDFQVFCSIHQWASVHLPRAVMGPCQYCRVHRDEARGRDRYLALQQDMLAQEMDLAETRQATITPSAASALCCELVPVDQYIGYSCVLDRGHTGPHSPHRAFTP